MVHDCVDTVQTLLTHELPQHSALEVQLPPASTQIEAVEHLSEAGSQKSEQHSVDSAHVAPTDLHSFGPLQRFLPSTSWSQWLSQQSLFCVQVSPVGLHDVAGTSHRPFTQLPEQQSVGLVHDWWNDRHVAQLTPTSHAVPKQQPFGHDVVLQTQAPFWHSWPAVHARPLPHAHWPAPVHPSESVGSHAMHTPPPWAHECAGGALQPTGLPVQQPVGHD
jgi:hypothetical protein